MLSMHGDLRMVFPRIFPRRGLQPAPPVTKSSHFEESDGGFTPVPTSWVSTASGA